MPCDISNPNKKWLLIHREFLEILKEYKNKKYI